MYQAKSMINLDFQLNKEILAALFNIERDFIKTDDRIKYSPCANAVRNTLIRGDGLGIQNGHGRFPKIHTVMRIEAAGFVLETGLEEEDKLAQYLCLDELAGLDSAIAVYRYMNTTKWLTDKRNNIRIESPQDLLMVYDHLEGRNLGESPVCSFRENSYQLEKNDSDACYRAPEKKELEELLNDFCSFISTDFLTPISQAALAQFQFKALMPFEKNLDQMGHLLIHYVLNRRHLLENITIPLNLLIMQSEELFYKYLSTGHTSHGLHVEDGLSGGERLIRYTTEMSHEILQYTFSLHTIISKLVDRWKERIEKLEKGSAAELLLYEFAGTPIMTTNQATQLINKSFSTTSNAMKILESAKIIKPGKSINRNKTFEAPDAILIHDAMYQKHAKSIREITAIA